MIIRKLKLNTLNLHQSQKMSFITDTMEIVTHFIGFDLISQFFYSTKKIVKIFQKFR
jgi:hypothetical protein